MDISYKILGPLIRRLPANKAHDVTIAGLKYHPFLYAHKRSEDSALKQEFKGRLFNHPIGLAPGFDKNAEVINPLAKLGFGHLEVGAVTPKAQAGNPRPTIFRSPSNQAIINRMGFNNKGLDVMKGNLKNYKGDLPIGVNIGKNKLSTDAIADYEILTQNLAAHVDWITINVSSPNTPGLRDLQNLKDLQAIIEVVIKSANQSPKKPLIFVKIAPDLNENDLVDLAHMFKKQNIDGVVTTNTTLSRPDILSPSFAGEAGGLSGRPLFDLSLNIQKIMAAELKGSHIKIIGSGGIEDINTAWQRIIYGASFLQIYTAMIWKGPQLAAQLAEQLSQKLKQEGMSHISEAIGSAL